MRRLAHITSLGLLGLVCISTVVKPDVAEADETAILRIAAVLATKERGGFDPRLQHLKHDLRSLPFRGYSLLAMQTCTVTRGDDCGMEVPANGFLKVSTIESTDRHLKLHLALHQQDRCLVNADLKLNRNAGILIKSTRTDLGTVLISIKASPGPPTGVGNDSVPR